MLQSLRNEILDLGKVSVNPDKIDLPNEHLDEDTQPLSEMTQVIASKRNSGRAVSLGKIEEALKKIENSPHDFGICQDCDEPIASKRLEIMPYAELCAACQQERDNQSKPTGRKHLLDFK